MNNLTQRIINNYKNLKDKDATAGIGLVATQELDNSSVKLLLYSKSPLTTEKVKNFVFAAFENKFYPIKGSVVLYQDEAKNNFATVVVASLSKIKISLDEGKKKGFKKITANTFLDEELGTVWERAVIDGQEMLVRNNNDNIEQILESVKVNASVYDIRGIDFAEFNASYEKGSKVDVYIQKDNMAGIFTGIVKSIDGSLVTVKLDDGDTVTVPAGSIIRTYRDESEFSDVINYLRKAYNPPNALIDYAGKFEE